MKTTKHANSLLRYLVIGGLTTCLLIVVKLAVEHTTWGHEFQLWIFGELQGSLAAIDLDNPVVVVDISKLPGGRIDQPTPREDLKTIISALADLQPQPRAIAVDINFSPKGSKYSAADDEEFFEFCLAIRNQKKVPVFLAVAETKTAPPEAWLGTEEYEELAVAVPGDKNDASRIPLLVKSPESSKPLNTLNYALALEYRRTLAQPHPWIGWAVDKNVELADELQHETLVTEGGTIEYVERMVNYSKLNQMKLAAHSDLDAASIKRAAANYSNKLVILGDLESDAVYVPGYGIYPGSLALGSATYTLIKEPLFEFKCWMRLLLDFLIAGSIIVAVALIRRKSPDKSWTSKQSLFITAAVLVVWFSGWGLVKWAGVLWLDFLLVALALLLHPKTEHLIDRAVDRFSGSVDNSDSSPPLPPETKLTSTETKNTAVGVALFVLLASAQTYAQQRPAILGCEKGVAAVGRRSDTGKSKSKKKQPANCYVRENKRSEWQRLTDKDVNRQYRAGQHLYCDAGCSLTLVYCGTGTEQVINTRKPDWFRVIHAYRPPPLFDPKKDNLLRVAQSFSPPDPKGRVTGDFRLGSGAAVGMISGASSTARAGNVDRSSSSGRTSPAARPPAASSAARSRRDAPAATPKSEFVDLLESANAARRAGDYTFARQLYLDAQKKDDTDFRVYQGLGNLYADEKDWSAAEQAYRDALKLQPRDTWVNLSLAFVMLESMRSSGDRSRAREVEQVLRLANTISPDSEEVYDLFEQLFALQDTDPRQMEPVFKRGVFDVPDSATMDLRYAQVLYRLGQAREALKFIRRAEDNAIGEELLSVAKVYENRGRYKDAERALRSAAEWMPDEPTVLYNLGAVLLQRKQYARALEVLQTASKLAPDAFGPVLVSGMAQLGKGDLAGAEISFDKASLKLSENTDAPQRLAYWFSVLGDEYRSKHKLGEAIRNYEKSLTLDPDNSDTREAMFEVRRQLNSKSP